MTVNEALKAVYALLKDESRWTKEHWGQDCTGYPCNPIASRACKWCLDGAIYKVGHSYDCDMHGAVSKALNDAVTTYTGKRWDELGMIGFNGLKSTTHEDILAVIQIAIKESEEAIENV